MRIEIDSGGLRLAGHLYQPDPSDPSAPGAPRSRGLVLCHGFPAGPGGSATSGQTFPEFAERLATDTGWTVLTFNFRGAGASEGDFSLSGWLTDLRAAIDFLLATGLVTGVWLAGSGTGGAIAICAAAEDDRVRGVAALAPHADFRDWGADPEGFLEHTRRIGVVRDPAFPPDMDLWTRELFEIRPIVVIGKLPPRPVLLVHGGEDEIIHLQDARWLADATDGKAELRIVPEAGHRLRHDPRAVAILIGWMERQPAD
ncbi:MAG: uncharacterized protein QOG82_2231 [Actinomycetota bacterium]|nr:uncharacterized protein [Actinomycetota bacterium]